MIRTVLEIFFEGGEGELQLFNQACREGKVSFQLQTVRSSMEAQAYLNGTGIYADRQFYPVPVLVLLDMKAPRLDGLDLIKWIRTQPGFRSLPVVVFAASKVEAEMKKAYDSGANSYLVKPVHFEELVEVIKTIDVYWVQMNQNLNI